MSHPHICVVHDPKPVKLNASYFHSTPRKVTEKNTEFWQDAPIGGSICKKCWKKFSHQPSDMKGQTEPLPKETSNVGVHYYNIRIIANYRQQKILWKRINHLIN